MIPFPSLIFKDFLTFSFHFILYLLTDLPIQRDSLDPILPLCLCLFPHLSLTKPLTVALYQSIALILSL